MYAITENTHAYDAHFSDRKDGAVSYCRYGCPRVSNFINMYL